MSYMGSFIAPHLKRQHPYILRMTYTHIEYFWNALDGLSQEDLCKFIKFACNQERIPQTCPCKEGGTETTHVPPYPMKIAPPDGAGMLSR
jgi:E3 ubiquitin-protein ligase HECTD4